MLTREERFWKKVNQNGTKILDTLCWEWSAHKTNKGYGQFWNGSKLVFAHRFSWQINNGILSDKLNVCHKCDNPSCVNPDHLFLGTQQDNVRDMLIKNRGNHNKKLTNTQVLQIYNSTKSVKNIAEEYNVHVNTIYTIKRGNNYKKITQHQFKKVGKGRQKLTDEQILLIFNSPKTLNQISEEFNIIPQTVSRIKKGKLHSKITGYTL